MSKWYISVMLNRLDVCLLHPAQRVLMGTPAICVTAFNAKERYGGDQFYSFTAISGCVSSMKGWGTDHDDELEGLIGNMPYLNGGIFQLHEVEQKYPDIQISDAARYRILTSLVISMAFG